MRRRPGFQHRRRTGELQKQEAQVPRCLKYSAYHIRADPQCLAVCLTNRSPRNSARRYPHAAWRTVASATEMKKIPWEEFPFGFRCRPSKVPARDPPSVEGRAKQLVEVAASILSGYGRGDGGTVHIREEVTVGVIGNSPLSFSHNTGGPKSRRPICLPLEVKRDWENRDYECPA